MRQQWTNVRRMGRRIWRGLRDWSGDSAYECYLRAEKARPGGRKPASREEFYVEQLNRRYSRPSRCC